MPVVAAVNWGVEMCLCGATTSAETMSACMPQNLRKRGTEKERGRLVLPSSNPLPIWAAQYITWLLGESTVKGVVLAFLSVSLAEGVAVERKSTCIIKIEMHSLIAQQVHERSACSVPLPWRIDGSRGSNQLATGTISAA